MPGWLVLAIIGLCGIYAVVNVFASADLLWGSWKAEDRFWVMIFTILLGTAFYSAVFCLVVYLFFYR